MTLPIKPLIDKFDKPLYLFQATVGTRMSRVKKCFDIGLDVELADKMAIKCGYHPSEVWGIDAWLEALEGAE